MDPGILYYHKDERKSQKDGSSSVNCRTGRLAPKSRRVGRGARNKAVLRNCPWDGCPRPFAGRQVWSGLNRPSGGNRCLERFEVGSDTLGPVPGPVNVQVYNARIPGKEPRSFVRCHVAAVDCMRASANSAKGFYSCNLLCPESSADSLAGQQA